MPNAVQGQLLDLWAGSSANDLDSKLLARFLSDRDEDAFACLVRRHASLVYGTCQRILGNRADADDAFQAVFFVLARRAHSLKLDRSLGPWLHGVALRVSLKSRGQIVRRRLRDMAAAKSERVDATESGRDFWAVIDEELARMPLPQREVVLLCDLGGQSHAQTAASLGVAKGTVTKRLARAREELAARLKRRGIALGLGVLTTRIATEATATVPASLLLTAARQAVANAVGPVGGSVAAQSLAEGVMRSIKVGVLRMWLVVGLLAVTLVGGGLMLAGGPDNPGDKKGGPPKGDTPEAAVGTTWRETYTVTFSDSLPVSVAFSADGRTVLTGDTKGEVMALIYPHETATYRWKANVGGSHAAVAFSTDRKWVYATTENGVRVLGETLGKEEARIDEHGTNPTAVGVFPNKKIAEDFIQSQIVFGNPHGYFVKTWADGKLVETMSTLEVSTVKPGAKPDDPTAVPLAVDPKGRSAIMTGLRDGTGAFGRKGKSVLWAYVCGDYAKESPGNRVLEGHTAAVVSAAWAKEADTAVTGDADGRVIVWDAKTMKETRRVELGGRVLALAITDDGTRTAACILGKHGSEVYVWETAKPTPALKPIHAHSADYGSEPYASLSFAPDGQHLAGCAIDKKWPQVTPKPFESGHAHVWELAAEPKAQLPPKLAFTRPLPKGGNPAFVIANNESIIRPADKEGAIDYRRLADGEVQFRLGLGKFNIGGTKLSADRNWMAMEEHAITNNAGVGIPKMTFDVGVYELPLMKKVTIPECSQLLDIAAGGKVVAVVREKKIELWDVATGKVLKAAPFEHTRIDAARFSPDGKQLALTDRNDLVLWQWQDNKHERIALGRSVGSLAFSPDGRFLAEGPTPGANIQVRDLETRKVVQELANSKKQWMNVPGLAYTQGGRVLIGCDNVTLAKEIAVPHRITLWDTATGTIAHQIELPSGLPMNLEVSPNCRYLIASIDDGEAGMKLCGWRLDGKLPGNEPGPEPGPAATVRPR
jgi:RNA polymerase sigma factor (sigma-70 family)